MVDGVLSLIWPANDTPARREARAGAFAVKAILPAEVDTKAVDERGSTTVFWVRVRPRMEEAAKTAVLRVDEVRYARADLGLKARKALNSNK